MVRAPWVRNEGRLSGSPAPEKMMSAFSAMAVDHVGEVRHGHHDVDADDAARPLARLAQLLLQPPDAGLAVILRIVVVDGSQSGRRDDADASLLGNGRGEARERNADAHAALYDGQRSEQVSDFQCFHG